MFLLSLFSDAAEAQSQETTVVLQRQQQLWHESQVKLDQLEKLQQQLLQCIKILIYFKNVFVLEPIYDMVY